jgi:hypothetical protein
MSVALEDQGEIVPSLGTTSNDALSIPTPEAGPAAESKASNT